MRQVFQTSIPESQFAKVKQHILAWANGHSHCAVYVTNGKIPACSYQTYEVLAGVGCLRKPEFAYGQVFKQLKQWPDREWLFGYLGYDLKNETEVLTSANPAFVPTADCSFFIPETVIELWPNGQLSIEGENSAAVWETIQAVQIPVHASFKMAAPVQSTMSEEAYLDKVRNILDHIKEGDVYELNLCREFYGEVQEGDPLATFIKLNQTSPMPFASYVKLDEVFVLGASPERFLQKQGNKLISQPIKGTIGRGKTPEQDKENIQQLLSSEKERAENLMIVDLVRNDLARSCQPGTVRVEELFGIYSFERVHQMISTVTGELTPGLHWSEAIQHAFPMGSMTGAPKVKAMQLIEHYEHSKRGIYSGAIGYITPQADFDLNVVIRSLVYRADTKKLSFQVGGAITWGSVPEAEYEECMLKAQAILQVLGD